jgi:transaldolase
MKFFLDSANITEIRQAAGWGVIDGITTNPSLVAKQGKNFRQLLDEICEVVDGPISAEAISLDTAGMVREGRQLARLHRNIVVKLPLTQAGLAATKSLTSDGIPVNVTLCFSAVQGLLAAKAGATYISPFIGRLDDIGQDGMELIQDLRTIYDNYQFDTQILVASIRHTLHVMQAALIGGDVATIPFSVLQKLAKHPLTDQGLADFLKDWESVPANRRGPLSSSTKTSNHRPAARRTVKATVGRKQ